jgi:hypothetical protein
VLIWSLKRQIKMKINVLFGDVFIELQSASKQSKHLCEGKVLVLGLCIIDTAIPVGEIPKLHRKITTPAKLYLTR